MGAAIASVMLFAGCTATMADLSGERTSTSWVTPPAEAGPVDVPATFRFGNRSLGAVRIESARLAIGTVVETVPPLPATVGPGGTLEVRVTGSFDPMDGDARRTVRLETAGMPSLEMVLEARFVPAAPSQVKPPAAIAP
ncbi:MAG: hypothetical protein ACKOHI_00045 [Phycisphaerales bacterium]